MREVFDLIRVLFFLKIYKKIDRAESTTGYSDLQFLFLSARDGWGEGSIVEIGAYKGKSTIALALGAQTAKREKVLSVDPHEEGIKEIYLQNLKNFKVTEFVVSVDATSEEAALSFRNKVRLLFIDGNHDYEFVKKDILLWQDFIIDGGILAFHDYNFPGVARAIDECIVRSGSFIREGSIGCTLYFSKKVCRNKALFEKMTVFNSLKRIFLR